MATELKIYIVLLNTGHISISVLADNTSNTEVLILEISLYTLVGTCKRYAATKWIYLKASKP